GASKTDVAAQLPALNLLMVISVVAAGLFVWNIWRRGWVLPVIAVGLWGFVALVIGTIVPAAYQQFSVQPNELANEKPYIARNIKATRAAFGLAGIKAKQFDFRNDLTATDLEDNRQTISNARLWESSVISTNFQQFQSLQTYYKFNNADTDRYIVDGQLRQVLVAARELNSADLPSQSWVNRHVVYTHGYGAVVSPANSVDEQNGQPNYLLQDIPGRGKVTLKTPQLYFGEKLDDYALVDAKQAEFDYARQGRDQTTRYKGAAGVGLSSWIRRAAFSLRFGDQNLLISSQIEDKTRIIFRRDILQRAEAAAPFLSFDRDPYPVLDNATGHLTWVLDGFTTSDHYPYSQSVRPNEGGVAGKSFNYIRNSVKATVDAYDGTITFYVVDPSDPLIKAYRSAFPDLFTDFSKMSPDVRAHLRYPQDLFRYQTDVYTKYHVQNATAFFSGAGFWEVSAEPRTAGDTGTTAVTSVNSGPQNASSGGKRVDPLYVLSKLPGQTTEEFLILRPFVPVSKSDSQNRLSAFMVARADPNAKQRLESLEMPEGLNVPGPVQVDRTINTTKAISKEFTLLGDRGSTVVQGSIQIIPVKDSLLYIQPIYVQSENGGQPTFGFVIASYAGEAKFGTNLEDALLKFDQFRDAVPPPTTSENPNTTEPPPTSGTSAVDDLLRQADAAYAAAQQALDNKDLGAFQAKVAELGDILTKLADARAAEQGSAKASGTTTTTTRAPAGSSSGAQALGR
ncbi:MAG: UPF0182 family protein, partial [Acidimicrobiia bacterium]|nr:UPF0182 family protein [Acidimicrobiia bacterium]